MRTILITGGANGLGKGVALRCLAEGDRVVAIGHSAANGESFRDEAKRLGAEGNAIFIQADLSLAKESMRIAAMINDGFPALDALVLCASRHCKEYSVTAEGLEFSFALDYLSRFIFSYGLKECLEKTESPVIMNVCGTGMEGDVNWGDLQHENEFDPMKVMMHGSRLNELSGVAFVQNDTVGRIKYVLYNPMAVRTPGMMAFGNAAMKAYYKFAAKPVDKAALPMVTLLRNPPGGTLAAYKEQENVSLDSPAFDKGNAMKLYGITTGLLEKIGLRE